MSQVARLFISVIFLVLITITICKSQSSESEKICRVYSISMNKICKEWDGQWQGIGVGSDGNCYFSTSTHSASHGSGFHRFNPNTKQHTILSEDLTITCGEGNTLSQQGKVHSPIVEHEGWIYFTTHLSNYWPEGIERYTGAHALGYELSTGQFRDFGIIRPRFSTYTALGVDKKRNKLYTFVVPFVSEIEQVDGAHLYSIDIDTGEKIDLGQVSSGRAASFWFFVDYKGNCWFTLWKYHGQDESDKGNLYVYRPATGKIQTYIDVLPKGRLFNGTPVSDEQNELQAWTWASALPGNKQCLFTMGSTAGGDERLWSFDPSKNIESGKAFKPIASIGSTFLETALGGDRLYFVQYASLEDQRTLSAEELRDNDPDSVNHYENLHLRSVSINPQESKAVIDHGKIVDQDGRAARMINSLAADENGRVFMMGSWYVKSPKEASLQTLFMDYWRFENVYKNYGEGMFKLMKRGEFFAVAYTADN